MSLKSAVYNDTELLSFALELLEISREDLIEAVNERQQEEVEDRPGIVVDPDTIIVASWNCGGASEMEFTKDYVFTLWRLLQRNSVSICALQEIGGITEAQRKGHVEFTALDTLVRRLNELEPADNAVWAHMSGGVRSGYSSLHKKKISERLGFIYRSDNLSGTLGHLKLTASRDCVFGDFIWKRVGKETKLMILNLHALSSKAKKTEFYESLANLFAVGTKPITLTKGRRGSYNAEPITANPTFHIIAGDFNLPFDVRQPILENCFPLNEYTYLQHSQNTYMMDGEPASSLDHVIIKKGFFTSDAVWVVDKRDLQLRGESSAFIRNETLSDHLMVIAELRCN